METRVAKQVKIPSKITTPRRICVGPAQKGLMQKFIKTRAKSITDNNNNLDDKGSPIKPDALLVEKGSPIISSSCRKLRYHQSIYSPKPTEVSIPRSASIERDESGKPIRRGYIPAEEKIQLELNDIRNRESELRRSRRSSSLSSQPDLVTLVKTKSPQIGELTDECNKKMKSIAMSSQFSNSVDSVFSEFSEIASANSSFNYHQIHHLPQRKSFPLAVQNLFNEFDSDIEEDEPVSSRKLIRKWEKIIKENSRK